MEVLTIDFETYYDQQYSLKKLTTEEYLRDPRFEAIGVSVKRGTEDAQWFSGTRKQTAVWLDQFDWANSVVVAHNAMFDMAILSWQFEVRPKRIVDTLSMARAIHGTEVGGSLDALTRHYNLGQKGDEVINALGKRRIDFAPEDLERYGSYCKNDVELTYKLFEVLAQGFPLIELKLIDLTIRMFTEPVLELSLEGLITHLSTVRTKKERLLASVTMVDKEQLMSNPKFAATLKVLGVVPPTKISPTTGKETYAFSKSDEEFKALLEHEDLRVQAIVAARLGVKSTIEETRTERFMAISVRGPLPIPLRYYAAHTGRWGGDDKVNMQNLPRKSPLKNAILAPEGYVIVDSDSSQIEARTLAWLAEQNDLVDAFEQGQDVYRIMAAAIYNKKEEDISPEERFVGKTTILGCIAEGTLVLSDSGWKPIEQVSLLDKLWDGKEWVCHQGLVTKGYKKTVNVCGSWLTPDHKILCGKQWKETQYVVADENTLSLALGTGAANLPLLGTLKEYETELQQSSLSATAALQSTPSIDTTSKISKVLGATYALKRLVRALANCIGGIATYFRMTLTGNDFSTEYLVALAGVTPQVARPILSTGGGASQYTNLGALTVGRSYAISSAYPTGTTPSATLTESTTVKGMNPATYDSQLGAKTQVISVKSVSCSRNLMTYDIAYAGPRNRFTIATNAGPLIVHNCGYGMGAKKFRAQLKTFGVDIAEEQAAYIIEVYRSTYPKIPILWKQAGDALKAIANNQFTALGRGGLLTVEGSKGIRLPNDLYIKYPNLRRYMNEGGKEELVYDTKKGRTTIPNRIYGGKVIENVCQALARIVIGEQMLRVAKKYRVVMTVHDAIGCIVPEAEADTGKEYVELCMRLRPEWALDLPLNCEAGMGDSYGDC